MDERHDSPQPKPPVEPAQQARQHLRDAARGRMDVMRTFGELGSLGLSLVFAIVIGSAGGWWLDKWTGMTPLFFFIGFAVGLAAAVRSVFVTTRRYMK